MPPLDFIYKRVNDLSCLSNNTQKQARPLIAKAKEDGDYNELVDPRLKSNYNQNEMEQMASCAEAGVRHSARRRPKMSQVSYL